MQRRWRQVGCGEAEATPLAKLPACADGDGGSGRGAGVGDGLKTTPLRSPSARGCGRGAGVGDGLKTSPLLRGSPFGSSPLWHAPSALRRARRRETRRLAAAPRHRACHAVARHAGVAIAPPPVELALPCAIVAVAAACGWWRLVGFHSCHACRAAVSTPSPPRPAWARGGGALVAAAAPPPRLPPATASCVSRRTQQPRHAVHLAATATKPPRNDAVQR